MIKYHDSYKDMLDEKDRLIDELRAEIDALAAERDNERDKAHVRGCRSPLAPPYPKVGA